MNTSDTKATSRRGVSDHDDSATAGRAPGFPEGGDPEAEDPVEVLMTGGSGGTKAVQTGSLDDDTSTDRPVASDTTPQRPSDNPDGGATTHRGKSNEIGSGPSVEGTTGAGAPMPSTEGETSQWPKEV